MPTPVAMTASYSTLLERVGHYLFGIRSGYSSDQVTDIEEQIRDGLMDVYSAHNWSFFRPIAEITTTAPYATGTVTIASGVVTLTTGVFPSWAAVGILKVDDVYYDVDARDSDTQVTLEDTSVTVASASTYTLGRPEYDLPVAFEAISGDSNLHYEPGQSNLYPPVQQRHDSLIRAMHQGYACDEDRPVYYSVRTTVFDPTVGSRKRLAFYPTPDAAYVLKVPMILRPTMIDATNEFPVGGETLSQLITESCLRAAERNLDEMEGRHAKRFEELLPLSIKADNEKSSPTSLGADGSKRNRSFGEDQISRALRIGAVSINGIDF